MQADRDSASREEFRESCVAVVRLVADYVDGDTASMALHIVDYEPAAALLVVADAVVETGSQVPRSLLERLRELGDQLIPDDEWPTKLFEFASDGDDDRPA